MHHRSSFDGSGVPVINDDTTVPANLSGAAAQEYGFTLGEQVTYARGAGETLNVKRLPDEGSERSLRRVFLPTRAGYVTSGAERALR